MKKTLITLLILLIPTLGLASPCDDNEAVKAADHFIKRNISTRSVEALVPLHAEKMNDGSFRVEAVAEVRMSPETEAYRYVDVTVSASCSATITNVIELEEFDLSIPISSDGACHEKTAIIKAVEFLKKMGTMGLNYSRIFVPAEAMSDGEDYLVKVYAPQVKTFRGYSDLLTSVKVSKDCYSAEATGNLEVHYTLWVGDE